MAVPWSTLFGAIPWSDVIARAPDIAQGARKLWQKAGRRGDPPPDASPVAPSLDVRVDALAARLAEVAARQQDSAELLAALATQQAELIRATDALHRRARLLGIACAILGLALAGLATAILVRAA